MKEGKFGKQGEIRKNWKSKKRHMDRRNLFFNKVRNEIPLAGIIVTEEISHMSASHQKVITQYFETTEEDKSNSRTKRSAG